MLPVVLDASAGSSDGITNVMNAANSLVEFAATLFDTIVSNPILVIFVGSSFVGIGLSIVRSLKRTARN